MFFFAARIWQVLTHQCRFQCGHVGTYSIFIAFLPHQLRRLAKFQGGTKKCVWENCRVSSTRQSLPCSSWVYGIWTRRVASRPRFCYDVRPQKPPSIRKITSYLVKQRCTWLLNWTTDGELRICVPVSDVINGQFDESVRILLGLGGESHQKRFYCWNEQMIISTRRSCLHEVRRDYRQRLQKRSGYGIHEVRRASSLSVWKCAGRDCF